MSPIVAVGYEGLFGTLSILLFVPILAIPSISAISIRKKGFGHRETQVALVCSRDSKDIKDQKSPGLPQS